MKIIFYSLVLLAVYLVIGLLVYLFKKQKTVIENNKKDTSAAQVDPGIYDADYYLHAYSGDVSKYLSNLGNLSVLMQSCYKLAELKPEEKVLDLGCGRGDLSFFCVLQGFKVTAVDYSEGAVKLAQKTREMLPKDKQNNLIIKQSDFKVLDESEKYDVVFMADFVEHLHNWELKLLFEKMQKILRPKTGRLIIHTAPNRNWINIIFPLKKILDWPGTILKGKDFHYKRDKYSYDAEMHVNELTPTGLRKFLKNYNAKVWCDDDSSNIISQLTKNFAGSNIWCVAKTKV
ncbi:MAG: class I SAM-dependent methyltransferase [Candidatus Omnitrophota bacterium]